jgi:import inner membrane translocase subunit TIM10
MSFLGLGGNPGAGGNQVNQMKVEAAEAELDMVSDMFNRLVDSCHQKCIKEKYNESELNKSESLCLDRCVEKYFEVNTKVGEVSITIPPYLSTGPNNSHVAHAKTRQQPKLHGQTLIPLYVYTLLYIRKNFLLFKPPHISILNATYNLPRSFLKRSITVFVRRTSEVGNPGKLLV